MLKNTSHMILSNDEPPSPGGEGMRVRANRSLKPFPFFNSDLSLWNFPVWFLYFRNCLYRRFALTPNPSPSGEGNLKSSFVFTLLCFGLLLTGCQKEAVKNDLPEGASTYAVYGVIQEITEDRSSASIQHEEIKGYMIAMTMNFNIKDSDEIRNITAGDEVTFRLVVTEEEHWIDQIERVGATTLETNDSVSRASTFKELTVGDLLPDHELLDENGDTIQFSDFRGKVLAFTFIFTRCPIPEYCPLMSTHFTTVRTLLNAQENTLENYQFLSISFDPDYDTPEVLKSYAGRYRGGNADRWLFAAAPIDTLSTLAPELDLMLTRGITGGISHNLRTVVLDTEGRITKQFDGNLWTPEQLVRAINEALKK